MIQGTVYLGDMELLGVVNVKGRNPRTDSEIAIGVATARETGKTVGDDFELNIEGHTLRFTVVGVYQSIQDLGPRISHAGVGGLACRSAVRADVLWSAPGQSSQVDEFIRDVERQFGEAAHRPTHHDFGTVLGHG